MIRGLGRSGIARRVLVVGAIPILVAAAIALGAWILLYEAERARTGAVVATETAQTLTSMNRARADAVSGGTARRDEAERRFDERAATAAGQLERLEGLARTRGQSALVATVTGDLNSQVTRMRSLLLSERTANATIADMARRADALVALTDVARRRQQQDNAQLIAVLAVKDAELERNQGVVTALRELREAISTAELNRARIGRPVFPIEFDELAADLRQLDAVGDRLRRVLRVDGEAGAADRATELLKAYRDRSRTEDGLNRVLSEGFELTRATQAGRVLVEWCDQLVQVNVTRQNRLYEEVALLIRHSVLSNEAELSAQDIALTALRLARRTDAALARRDTAEASRVLEAGAELSGTSRTLLIPVSIRDEMAEAIDGWRTQLAATIEKIGEQNETIADMDSRAATMSANAQTLSRAFIDDADQFGSVIRQLLVVGAVGALCLGIGAAAAVARSITRPLHALQHSIVTAAAAPAPEDIGRDSHLLTRRDELGDIARATNAFLEQIRRREADRRNASQRADDALTTLRQAQEDLIRAERLASLGQLVAGVSHEISTPLGIALTTATQVQSDSAAFARMVGDNQLSRSRLTQYAGRMREGAQLLTSNLMRAADLLYSFKQVAADQAIEDRRPLNLAKWIDELLKSLRALARPGRHVFEVDCPPDLVVDTLPGILAQVVSNAVKNAIEHGFQDREGGRITITGIRSGDGIGLSIADDGRGIDGADLGRVFDPFFTTARARGGTGLGLHIVHNLVVNRLQGRVELQSSAGAGTVLRLWLPERLA
ncbi:HAMP domain-containing sensor histidine kinase [Methylobacterium sp. 13MFTsu3.1M2]|uniref:sensor histidine kinase n=1 Tax=Methylobacterium sp. 13MFTsu3.1M2 TaxID=1502776 RepID=UPI0008E1A58E|nr:HAMP domain-containing sensor histidine kinase [Methylobacterium sp. 13MFTsu3.1M2]SFD96250.1 Signal transduction histidine kinase [Methylobacterium sp. 13MFTsu3.1M2]